MTQAGHNGSNKAGLTYADAGVDIDAGNAMVEAIKPLVSTTRRSGADGSIGGFGGLFDLKAAGYRDPILVAANDGVGTKVKIAIETGRHDTVGIDLVAMCVNDLIVQGAEPLFFLDYYATGRLNPHEGTQVVRGIVEGCRQAGCALLGGETAEMPGLYAKGDYDLAGFAVGAVERDDILPRQDMSVGDVILGLPSSGAHANGFSLIRHIVSLSGLSWEAPAPFAPGKSLGEALLEPTRIYVRSLLAVLRKTRAIKGLAHITGGGFLENIPRILPKETTARLELNSIPSLPVFEWISHLSQMTQTEMLRTFNCGIGMIIIVQEDQADTIIKALAEEGEKPVFMGDIAASTTAERVVTTGKLPL